MKGSAIPLSRLWRPTLAFSAPGVIVFVLLAILDRISVSFALIGCLLIIAGTGIVVRFLLRDTQSLRNYAANLADDPTARRPDIAFAGSLTPLLTAIRSLADSADSQRSRQSAAQPSGLDHLPDAVLMLDSNRVVLRDNMAARALLGDSLVGRDLASVLRNPNVLRAVDSILQGRADILDVEFSFQVPVERHFSARIAGVESSPSQPIAAAIALNDLTEMKRAQQLRSDFVANASHELRTPISVLLGGLQTLRGPARNDPKAQEGFVTMMEGQAERMARLVDDLLSLSRIEMNEHSVPSDRIDLGILLGEVRDTLSLAANAQGMSVEIDMQDDIPPVPGDLEDLTKVFQNLLDNAIKYGADESCVTLTVRRATVGVPPSLTGRSGYIAVSVADEGEGIEPELIPRLTERFFRTDAALSRRLGGTGLGLAIVKHAVNRHRGALSIESTPGKGSTFTVYLPRAAEPAPEKAPAATA